MSPAASRDVLFVIVRIRHALQVAAEDGLGLIVFGGDDGLKTFRAVRDVHVAAHVVDEVSALQQEHGHPGVVVARRGDVAIGATLRLSRAHRVRHERRKRFAAEAFGRDGLLRVVEPFAVRILRTDQNGARGPRRRDAMSRHGAVHAEHVTIVAEHLEVVRSPVARQETFVVQHRAPLIGRHLEMAAETVGRPRGVAGVTGHAAIGVGEHRGIGRNVAPGHAVGAQGLRQPRFFVVVRIARRDRIERLHHFPFLVRIHHRALVEPPVAPLESPPAPRRSQRVEMRSARRRRGPGSEQGRALLDRAVAIDAIEFDRGARLAEQFSRAVRVLLEMAIHALHSLLEVDVLEMHGLAESIRVVERHDVAVGVEQIPFAVSRVDGAIQPAVPVEIGKLRLLQFRVEFGASGAREKIHIGPQAAHGRAFGIALRDVVAILLARMALLGRVHRRAVGLVVPPRIAEIRRHHVRAGMNVARHALARWNRARENVANRMARFVARNRRIVRSGETEIAESRVLRGMFRRAVVRVNDVTRRAAAGAVIARLIVCARQREKRIEQARLLQTEKDGIRAQLRTEPARAELVVRFARLFFERGLPNFAFPLASAFKYAQDVARLRNLPSFERRHFRENSLSPRRFRRRGWNRMHGLRRAVARVTLSEARVLVGIAAVVVKRRAPKNSSDAHHARRNVSHHRGVATGLAARFRGNAQVARIDEANVFGALLQPRRVGAHRIRRAIGQRGIARRNMRAMLGFVVFPRTRSRTGRRLHSRIAAMAIRAAEPNRTRGVHRGLVRAGVAGDAARALARDIRAGLLQQQRWRAALGLARRRRGQTRAGHRQRKGRQQRRRGKRAANASDPISAIRIEHERSRTARKANVPNKCRENPAPDRAPTPRP